MLEPSSLKNSTARKPLLLIVSATFIIILSLVMAYIALRSVIRAKDKAAFDYSNRLQMVQQLSLEAEKKIASSRGYIMLLDSSQLENMHNSRERFLGLLSKLEHEVTSQRGENYLKSIALAEETHQMALDAVIAQRQKGMNLQAATRALGNVVWPKRRGLNAALEDFQNFQNNRLNDVRSESVENAHFAENLLLLMGLLTFVTIPALASLLFRSLRKQEHILEQAELSSERFQDLVNHLDHSVVWEAHSSPFEFTFVSERSQFLLGVSSKDWKRDAETFFALVPREEVEEVRRTLERAATSMNDQRCTHRMKTSDGDYIWVQTGAHPRRTKEGSILLYGVTMDVTPLKTTKDDLLKSQKQFSSILDNAESFIFMKDLKGRFTLFNQKLQQVFGVTAGQVIGKTDTELFGGKIPQVVEEADHKVLSTGQGLQHEEQLLIRGEMRTFFTIKFPLKDDKDVVYGLCGIATDITERKAAEEALKHSEERLSLSLEASGMGIWDWDIRTDDLVWTENTEKLFDYPVGQKYHKITDFEARVIPEDKKAVTDDLQHFINTGQEFRREFRIAHSNGKILNILSIGRAIYDDHQRPCRMVGIVVDITERKHFEKSLEEAVRVREELLAIVSHDLRNPLGAMLMGSSLIARKAPEDEFGRWVKGQSEKIRAAGQRMNDLIEDLLSLAKIEAGHFGLKPEPHSAYNIISEALDQALPVALGKNVRIDKDLQAPDTKVMADEGQILRVLGNLLSNAVKFTPEDGVVVLNFQDFQDSVCFSVKDTGPGIADHHVPHVFERFWQASGTAHKGTGLGLAISKGIVEEHGGKIWIDSKFGEGAHFYFTLPKAPH